MGRKSSRQKNKKTIHTIAPAEAELARARELLESESAESEGWFDRELDEAAVPAVEVSSEAVSTQSSTINHDQAMELACQLLTVSLQWRTLDTNDPASTDASSMLLSALDELEQTQPAWRTAGTALNRCQAWLGRLQAHEVSIVDAETRLEDTKAAGLLQNALHAVLSAWGYRQKFSEAVERACRRSIYQLAYGLTHEINNPLANIVARAQPLIAEAKSEQDKRSLATIVDQAMRAHEMLAEMMRVVQPKPLQKRAKDIVRVVEQAVTEHAKHWTHARIKCQLRLSESPLHCEADERALSEAISSLLQNAMQVCRPGDQVEVICQEVCCKDADFGPPKIEGNSTEAANVESRIRIAICDTGPGMSSEAAEAAWDLYFSGRESGRGLGISLANVRRIIDAHDGLVWIRSAPNAGCAVEIRLPKLPEAPAARRVFSI